MADMGIDIVADLADLPPDDADVTPDAGKTGCLVVPSFDTGHAKYSWDKHDKDDVAKAEKTFNDKLKLGYAAFRVDPKTGDKGEKIKKFDPNAEQIILVPAFAGG